MKYYINHQSYYVDLSTKHNFTPPSTPRYRKYSRENFLQKVQVKEVGDGELVVTEGCWILNLFRSCVWVFEVSFKFIKLFWWCVLMVQGLMQKSSKNQNTKFMIDVKILFQFNIRYVLDLQLNISMINPKCECFSSFHFFFVLYFDVVVNNQSCE